MSQSRKEYTVHNAHILFSVFLSLLKRGRFNLRREKILRELLIEKGDVERKEWKQYSGNHHD